ncbi:MULTISPECIES: hypothetical protein [unclassified Isoptericola]|uniref:hypothetical protein n=1 Tax=unclassified Isoptericola TaxID=2623355 RepID=UPI0036590B48
MKSISVPDGTSATSLATLHALRARDIHRSAVPPDVLDRLVADDLTARDLAYLCVVAGTLPSTVVAAAGG